MDNRKIVMEKLKDNEAIVTEFFKRRFPDKKIKFEKECSYFDEWVNRFKSGSPTSYMDEESLEVYNKMKSEGII